MFSLPSSFGISIIDILNLFGSLISNFKIATVTNMCALEDLKFHQARIQEIIVFIGTATVCKHRVTSKQKGGGLIVVCVGVWITLLQPVPAGEPIQLQL